MNKIFTLKLVSGESIVGEIDDNFVHLNDDVTIKNPMQIRHTITESGKSGVIFVKYLTFTKDDTVQIKSSNIITVGELYDEVVEYYKQSINYENEVQMKLILSTISAQADYLKGEIEDFKKIETAETSISKFAEEFLKIYNQKETTNNISNNIVIFNNISSNTVN